MFKLLEGILGPDLTLTAALSGISVENNRFSSKECSCTLFQSNKPSIILLSYNVCLHIYISLPLQIELRRVLPECIRVKTKCPLNHPFPEVCGFLSRRHGGIHPLRLMMTAGSGFLVRLKMVDIYTSREFA